MAHTVQNWSKNTATNQLHCPVPNEHILRVNKYIFFNHNYLNNN